MKHKTHIQWPSACCPAEGNYSNDTHETKELAEGVISMLKSKGFGFEGKFFPERTAITEDNELNTLAETMFDYACATRRDALTKEGLPGDPRKVCGRFCFLQEPAQQFYRSLAQWHLNHKST